MKNPYLCKEPKDLYAFSHPGNNVQDDRHMCMPGFQKYIDWTDQSKIYENFPYKDFEYFINPIGFRDDYPELDEECFAFFGCSFTFGVGLPSEYHYVEQIADNFDKSYLNMGIPGSGIYRQYITFLAAANVWNIDTAIFNFPPLTRWHYVDENYNFRTMNPPYPMVPKTVDKIKKQTTALWAKQHFIQQAIDSINGIITVAKLKNIKLILSSWDNEVYTLLTQSFNVDATLFKILDVARDNSHPGLESSKQYTDTIVEKINQGLYA